MWLYGQKPVTAAREFEKAVDYLRNGVLRKKTRPGLPILIVNAFGGLRFNS
jgi:hypothetical protein